MNDTQEIFKHFKTLLTPEDFSNLVKKSHEGFLHLTCGHDYKNQTINQNFYPCKPNQQINFNNISFIALCKHHLLPFFGKCDVEYITKDRIIGLSKIKEIVQNISLQLILQEDLNDEIFEILKEILDPMQLKITITAKHTCLMLKNPSNYEDIITSRSS